MRPLLRLISTVFLLTILAGCAAYCQTSSPTTNLPTEQPPTPTSQVQPIHVTPLSYSLSPDSRARAIVYSRLRYLFYFVGTAFSLGVYFLLWRTGFSSGLDRWVRGISPRLFVQCLIFVPFFAAAAALLKLPFHYYSDFVLEHRFGLSTQELGSWLLDWAKSLGVTAAVAVVMVYVYLTVVRRSPRRWWFYFWMASLPLVLGFILIEPYAIEPLFDHFTPLQRTQPGLVDRIEAMTNHISLSIPTSHIYEMDASSRTTAVNAYVSGLGASKRVVIWDTTLKAMGPDEILLVLGHETGHYVLHHIPKEFALDEAVALVFFFIGFIALNRLARTVSGDSAIIKELSSLPLALIVLILLVLLSDPIVNGISRYYEHQADQFGLEVAYGIVPDPNAAEVQALQSLGDIDLADPDPSPIIKFWLYTHPPLAERIQFAATYRPWAEGRPMELLPQVK